jgi:hypothetical protein
MVRCRKTETGGGPHHRPRARKEAAALHHPGGGVRRCLIRTRRALLQLGNLSPQVVHHLVVSRFSLRLPEVNAAKSLPKCCGAGPRQNRIKILRTLWRDGQRPPEHDDLACLHRIIRHHIFETVVLPSFCHTRPSEASVSNESDVVGNLTYDALFASPPLVGKMGSQSKAPLKVFASSVPIGEMGSQSQGSVAVFASPH